MDAVNAPHDHLRMDSRMSAADSAAGFRLFRSAALEAQRQALLRRVPINPPLVHGSAHGEPPMAVVRG